MFIFNNISKFITAPKNEIIHLMKFVIIATLIVLWALMLFTSFREKNRIISAEKDQLERMCQIVAEQTGNIINDMKILLQTLDLWLTDHPNADPKTDPVFCKLVNQYRTIYAIPIDIRLVSESDGLFYIPSKSTKPLAIVSEREYVRAQKDKTKRGFFIAEPVKSSVTKIWGIPISYPITSKNKGMSILFSAIELPNLNILYEAIRSKPNGTISLMRTDGKVLNRVPFDEKIIGTSMVGGELWANVLNLTKQNDVILIQNSRIDNSKRLLAYRKIKNLPLITVVTSRYDDVIASWTNEFALKIIIMFFMSTIILKLGRRVLWLFSHLNTARNELESANTALNTQATTLKQELSEKEIIIREIYHRMKNYVSQMMFMIGLVQGDKAADSLETLKARVHSFSVLFEKLTYSENINLGLNLKSYLDDLISRIIEVYHNDKKIQYTLTCDKIILDPKKTTIAGLILSEMITNSIKYAFDEINSPEITISINLTDSDLTINYEDNGPGFDFDNAVKNEEPGHFGFILINSLVKQQKGSIQYSNAAGSHFKIVIKQML